MKKNILYILLLLAPFFMVACHDTLPMPKDEFQYHRTVLVYMAGENSLSGDLWSDMEEMRLGGVSIPDSCNVLVYYDGLDLPSIYRLDAKQRLEKCYSFSKDQNSCDSLVMQLALRKMVQMSPSKHYGLVMASHASGWIPQKKAHRRTFGIDNNLNTGSDRGNETEIQTLRGVLETLPHFDYILFDACFMQSIETAFELKEVSDWIIASPAEIPGPGAPYDVIMKALCAADIEQIVNGYHSDYPQNVYSGVVLSAVCTSALNELARQTAPHIITHFANRAELHSSHYQSYSLSYLNYTHCFDLNSVMSHLLSAEAYAQWLVCFNQAVPFRPLTTSWYSGYNYGTTCHVHDSDHYGAISMFLPSQIYQSQGWNTHFHQMHWYEAAGWSQTGW